MKIGIIGRTAAGRSTLFEGLVGGQPGQSNRLRLGTARVGDPRVEALSALCKPKKTTFAEISLALPPGALNVPAVREMRDLKAFAHVIGIFAGEDPDTAVAEQISELTTEMVLADMERIEKRIERIERGGGDRPGEKAALARASKILEGETVLRLHSFDEQATALIDELGVVSHRPLLTVINVAEDLASSGPSDAIKSAASAVGSELLWLCATLEREITELDSEAQQEFLAAYDLTEPVTERFTRACLALLDQICFFTIGPDEVRAWPIAKGTHARRAARTIHSDLEKGFIRAEVMDYDTLLEFGSEASCRSAGKLRVEGKEYIVQDGDIITVRFNV